MMKHAVLIILALVFATTRIQAQRIKGSDTVLPIAQQTAERFMKLNPNARVTVTGGGTGVGISALLDETTDIAMASRGIKFSEKMKAKAAGEELAEITIAYDALAVRVFQRERAKKQELYEQQPFHACHRSNHTIGQPDTRSYRLRGTCLCIAPHQDSCHILR